MIRLRGIAKRFELPVLRGVDLAVPRGCLYGLVGPPASGKSVVLKIVCGLVRPDAGEVHVGGSRMDALDEAGLFERRREIGMLFQNNALFDFMNVAENVAFPLRRLETLSEARVGRSSGPPRGGLVEEEVGRRVAERLARVGLAGFESRAVRELSGGQKKRVGIARATITAAPLLLYDEPAAGLDPVTSQRIFDLLRAEQRAAAGTVLMVSSDIDRLLTVTDRLAMLHEGRIVFEGTTSEARGSVDPLVRQFLHGLAEGPL